jgi:hypothetical protein
MDLIGTLQFNMMREANSRDKLKSGGLMKNPAQTTIVIDIFSYIHTCGCGGTGRRARFRF